MVNEGEEISKSRGKDWAHGSWLG